jgi:RNA polymerase sigma-70 factor (ECF subfamily)
VEPTPGGDHAPEPREFLTTRWSVVRAAGAGVGDPHAAREALASLCTGYWYPLYAFVRRRGHSSEDARDLTQAFFARLLERDELGALDPKLGRFRAWLLASARNFLANETERARAEKRGGGRVPIPIDVAQADSRFALEAGDDLSPERAFARGWALELLARTREGLRAEYAARSQAPIFDALEPTLAGADGDPGAEPRSVLAERLGMTTGAVDVAAHRLRQRFRERLRSEVAGTLTDPAEIQDEIAALFEALGR